MHKAESNCGKVQQIIMREQIGVKGSLMAGIAYTLRYHVLTLVNDDGFSQHQITRLLASC